MRYAISSCLVGVNCKYSGGNNYQEDLFEFIKDKDYIHICPEVLGGLTIPRASCEIKYGKVMNIDGEDCTSAFMDGAKLALEKLKAYGVDIVILQPRSPSCGIAKIYDGTFSNRLIDGNGIFVEMLIKEGIRVVTWEEYAKTLYDYG